MACFNQERKQTLCGLKCLVNIAARSFLAPLCWWFLAQGHQDLILFFFLVSTMKFASKTEAQLRVFALQAPLWWQKPPLCWQNDSTSAEWSQVLGLPSDLQKMHVWTMLCLQLAAAVPSANGPFPEYASHSGSTGCQKHTGSLSLWAELPAALLGKCRQPLADVAGRDRANGPCNHHLYLMWERNKSKTQKRGFFFSTKHTIRLRYSLLQDRTQEHSKILRGNGHLYE